MVKIPLYLIILPSNAECSDTRSTVTTHTVLYTALECGVQRQAVKLPIPHTALECRVERHAVKLPLLLLDVVALHHDEDQRAQ